MYYVFYSSAKALRHLGDYDEAAKRMKQAVRLEPDNEHILKELEIVCIRTLRLILFHALISIHFV